ncbi:MAG: tRNA (adenosine(37)-N6)-threonylcarbamoyltransferase complex ATPase subunit type 1 TsaE, partial [Raineya sp.]
MLKFSHCRLGWLSEAETNLNNLTEKIMNNSLPILCKNLSQLPEVAKKIVEICKNYAIWVFEGDMGAGKTTLIKAICSVLGV